MDYGLCPTCGAPGASRERRPNGNDTCKNGHTYPSREAKPSKTPPPRLPEINEVVYIRTVVRNVNAHPGNARPFIVVQPMNDKGATERAQWSGLEDLGVGLEFIVFPKEKLKCTPPRNPT